MVEQQYWLYILHCSNGSYYTGYTTDLLRRYEEHLQGSAKCKYTRSFKPLGIAQCWLIQECKSLVLKLEKSVKSLSREKKEQLILQPENLVKWFPCNAEKYALPEPIFCSS